MPKKPSMYSPIVSMTTPPTIGMPMAADAVNVSFAPMTRPRAAGGVVSAYSAVAEMFTPDQPSPTRNVPSVMIQ